MVGQEAVNKRNRTHTTSKNNYSELKGGNDFNLRRIPFFLITVSSHCWYRVLPFCHTFHFSFCSNMANFSSFSFLYSFHSQISFHLFYLRLRMFFFLFPPFCALLMHTQFQSHYFSVSFSTSRQNLRQVPRLALQRTTCDKSLTQEHLILCNWKH